MKAQIRILVNLQEIEDEILAISARLSAVADAIQDLENERQASRAALDTAQSDLKLLEQGQREKDAELKTNQSQLEKGREKQLSVKTNREFKAIRREIDNLKKKNTALQDEIYKDMRAIEEQQKALAEKETAHERLSRDIDRRIAEVKAGAKADEQALIRLQEKQQAMGRDLPPELWNRFELIKRKAGGIAIARVSDGVCEGCDMNLPPQLYNELQRLDSLRFCPHCQRMIYWEAPQPEAVEG